MFSANQVKAARALAGAAGVSLPMIQRVERGVRNMDTPVKTVEVRERGDVGFIGKSAMSIAGGHSMRFE